MHREAHGSVVGSHSYPSNSHKVLESWRMVSEHLKFECRVKELHKAILLTLWLACCIPIAGRVLRGASVSITAQTSLHPVAMGTHACVD